jgi:hypothetical protein
MRNLTIKRNKAYVACLAKMRVFIEDHENSDTNIGGVPCRKLGTLKNGEQQTFVIGEEAARVYVVSDMLAKNYSNDFYELPAGYEDIYLTGENRYNPANGHAFRFDGNTSEAAEANRKKGSKIGIVVLACALALGIFLGLASSGLFDNSLNGADKVFNVEDMTVTLNENFEVEDSEAYTGYITSDKVLFIAIEESFNDLPELRDLTLEEYGEIIREFYNNGKYSELKKENGLTDFEYDFLNGETYHYMVFVYKENDAFWLVQFATFADDAEECRSYIMKWASSVKFD